MNELLASGLAVTRGGRRILDGVDFALRPSELVLLAGRNGAGKTSLLRQLVGVDRPASGDVQLGGRALADWPALARARELAYVSQDAEHQFEFTGRELVSMGRHPHRRRGDALQPDDLAAIDRAIDAVDGVAFCDRPVTTMSGGEQRRIAVARALATEAPLLLLDEPTSNLDLEHALRLVDLLQRLANAGRGILVASHDLNLLAPRCNRVVLLHAGKVYADDAAERALSAANLAAVFGVRAADPAGYFPRDFRV